MKKIRAKSGDTLCTIAIRDGGFLNCDALRSHAGNASKLLANLKKGTKVIVPSLIKKIKIKAVGNKHNFKKKIAPLPNIRFVHGSKNLPYRQDSTLKKLSISNYPSDKGGQYPAGPSGPNEYSTLPALPVDFTYKDDAHNDEDTFKVEVVDPLSTVDIIKVKLTALKPVYLKGKVDSYVDFAPMDSNVADRKIEIECKRVKAGLKVFRSRYIRLVTNKADFDAIKINKQGLLVAPIADGIVNTDGEDSLNNQVEVLDQKVRAEYELSSCKASIGPKCILKNEISVGGNSKKYRVKTAVHILATSRGGTGVVSLQQQRKSLFNFVKEIYAQADLSLKLVKPNIRIVNPPRNLIAVSNEVGRRAQGGKTIHIRVRIDGSDDNVSIKTKKGHSPTATASRLVIAIRETCKVKAVVSTNPPCIGRALGSADILVGDPQIQNIRLTIVRADDAQAIHLGRITTTQINEFSGHDSHVGTLHERVLVKNYDSGKNHIDTFVVGTLHQNSFGEAFTPNKSKLKKRQPIDSMVNSIIIKGQTQLSLTHAHTTIPHEWAHILMDDSHIPSPTAELITSGAPVGINEQLVNAPRRIGGGDYNIAWDSGNTGKPVNKLSSKNKVVMSSW